MAWALSHLSSYLFMNGKILRIAFLAVFVVTLFTLLIYYYYYSNYLIKLQSTPPRSNGDTVPETLPLNRILTIKPERQIQALFVKVEGGMLFYKDKVSNGLSTQTFKIGNPVLYICRSPVNTEYIAIDSNNPGYLSYVDSEELNKLLKDNESILIATYKPRGGDEIVSYVATAKCEHPQ